MTDQELIELAARAYGISGEWVVESLLDDYYKLPTTGILTVSEGRRHVWNPLTSSGDALRLAVKLKLLTQYTSSTVIVCDSAGNQLHMLGLKDDPYAATRLAIVRAAAEIGKDLK